MKKGFIALIVLSFTFITSAECVHEKKEFGVNLFEMVGEIRVLTDDGKFINLDKEKINPFDSYTIQYLKHNRNKKNFDRYNRKYIEYYRYSHVQKFVERTKKDFESLGYESVVVGKSILGRDLYGIRPIDFDLNKKTIVMFGRHHGDEGTANWIIEGFVDELLKHREFFSEYQLVLYPMINPDGAEAQSRYNENDRDLNRSWSFDLSKSYDEARVIHTDLKKFLSHPEQIVIALDMHGSFTKDFIYRVKENYISTDFYRSQQDFIDTLATFDFWQKGNFELSNGHPKMARIVLVKSYGLNSLTHETPRDIRLKNRDGRSKKSLLGQGRSIFVSIRTLF